MICNSYHGDLKARDVHIPFIFSYSSLSIASNILIKPIIWIWIQPSTSSVLVIYPYPLLPILSPTLGDKSETQAILGSGRHGLNYFFQVLFYVLKRVGRVNLKHIIYIGFLGTPSLSPRIIILPVESCAHFFFAFSCAAFIHEYHW